MDIKKEIIDAIDPSDFWKEEFPEWDGVSKVCCPCSSMHEDGDDSTESLSLHSDGLFRCFGCNFHGTSVVGYYAELYCNNNFSKALAKMYHKYVHATLDHAIVKNYRRQLTKRRAIQRKILHRRGWLDTTLKTFRLGWDDANQRVSIPIYNVMGYCIDIRLHDSLHRQKGKRNPVVAFGKDSPNMQWFPTSPKINPFKQQEIWCMEGEPDVILATQEGINALTVTGGVAAWAGLSYDKLRSFENKDVVVCFDSDKAGREGAERFLKRLAEVEVASITNVRLPYPNCDVSDYLMNRGMDASDLRLLARKTVPAYKSKKKRIISVPLADTSKAEHTNACIRTNILVSGKHPAPYVVPKKLNLECAPGEEGYCPNCPCADREGRGEHFVHTDDPIFLQWLHTKQEQFPRLVKHSLGLPKKCSMKVTVDTFQNVEGLRAIPAMSDSSEQNENKYVERHGYYLGHGLEANSQYECEAIPASHPKSNESVLLIQKVSKASDSIGSFQLSKEQVSQYQSLFTSSARETLKHVAAVLSSKVTRIIGRPDLHIAVDLCFHSPLNFSFNGESVPKGSLELLLLGDTRCGKGQVAEGLAKFYDLGMTVSGENASFMGLVGGAMKSPEGRFMLSWGAFPLNHGRLVIVDEFSGLSEDVLGRTSRVRSEGIAEIDKGGIHAKTPSNVRTIWIANPRKGREMSYFNTGVEAILNLVTTQEDVARFDLALIVSKNEVDPTLINKQVFKPTETSLSREILRNIVLWCWSREPKHIRFTNKAVDDILSASLSLSTRYSSSIPLIQGENVRFKLAKIAAAIAGRCFSTPDGVSLKVTREHARLAVKIIKSFYDKPAFGYRAYSEHRKAKEFLVNKKELRELIFQFDKDTRKNFIEGMQEVHEFDVRDVQDWLDCDGNVAKRYLGQLVRCHAVKKLRNQYIKRPAFVSWLTQIKREL